MADLVTIRPKRSLGGFVAQIVVEEQHDDELTITEHPVETGAAITDHAYKNPAKLRLVYGWSNSSLKAAGSPNYVKEVYANLLTLQETRQPFDILTGKRKYTDMLVQSLSVLTEAKTEHSLMVTASCRQIIIVPTQLTKVPDSSVHADASKTGATSNTGTKQPVPATGANTAAIVTATGG